MTKDELITAYESMLMSTISKRLFIRNFGKTHDDKYYDNAKMDMSVCREDQSLKVQM